MNNRNKIIAGVVIVIIAIVGVVALGHKGDAEQQSEKVGATNAVASIPEEQVQADVAAIRAFMGEDSYSVTYTGSGSPSNFMVGKTTQIGEGAGRTDVPPEWKRTVNKYKSVQTVGIREEIYYFEVYPGTHEVVNAQLDNQQDKAVKPITGEAPTDDGIFTPKVSEAAIKTAGDAYLARAIPDYASFKSQFTVKPMTKDANVSSADRYEWMWQDTSYKVPAGLDAEPKYPTIRIYISSGGQLLQYNNSVPLFQE